MKRELLPRNFESILQFMSSRIRRSSSTFVRCPCDYTTKRLNGRIFPPRGNANWNFPESRRHFVSSDVVEVWKQTSVRLLEGPKGALNDSKRRKECHTAILWWLRKDHGPEGIQIAFQLLDRVCEDDYDNDTHSVELRNNLPDDSFDWVIFSRMVEELPEPGAVILEALRVGKRVAVSFVNHAYWRNRLNFLRRGKRVQNEVYPHRWEQSGLRNHFSIEEFEQFCAESQGHGHSFEIGRKVFHQGDWVKHCTLMPNLRSGLAIYELIKA